MECKPKVVIVGCASKAELASILERHCVDVVVCSDAKELEDKTNPIELKIEDLKCREEEEYFGRDREEERWQREQEKLRRRHFKK